MRFIVFLFIILPSLCVAQQLTVNNTGNNSDPVFLSGSVLPGGGMNVFNVSFSGNTAQQIGYYSTGSAAVGSASGVILSTGRVTFAAGQNDSTATGMSLGSGAGTDPDLLSLSGNQSVFDWFILEFDVQPLGNEFSLQYLFASEEYGEYVCSPQADVFGILISGPSISGPFQNNAQLISLVPSTSFPAGINSINDGVTGSFGSGACLGSGASPYYNSNTGTLFEFDGYTDVLTATAAVECDSMYHVRILIADVDNDGFDSGLLLPEKGMFSNGTGSFDGGAFNDSIIVEGCRPFDFNIYNPTGFTNGQTINLSISGTAINGTDYNSIPTSISLSSQDSLYTFLIQPIADGVSEGLETVIISYDLPTVCGDTITISYTVYIQDENPLVVTGLPSDQVICDGETVLLNINVSGGHPNYVITWNGVQQNNIDVAPNSDITFIAEVIDQAGCYWTGDFVVDHNPNPIVNAGPDIVACSQQNVTLGVQIDGGSGATYSWSPAAQLNSSSVAYPVMTPVSSLTYTVTVTSAAGCTGTDQLQVSVQASPSVNAGPDQSIVYLQTSTVLSGTGSGTPMWDPPYFLSCTNCMSPTANPLQTTTYTLYVTAANGCVASDQVTVTVEVPKDVFVPSAFSPNNDGNNDVLFARGYTIRTLKFTVFDLWGQIMFQSFDPSIGWDGTVNGSPASIGLYVYTLEVEFVNDAGTASFAGEINLVR